MDITKQPCGCTTTIDSNWGVTRAVTKCAKHRAEQRYGDPGLAYYTTENGGVENGIPQARRYIDQLLEPIETMDMHIPYVHAENESSRVLDIGCGLGFYAPLFLQRGYRYYGVEAADSAASYVENAYRVPVFRTTFERLIPAVHYHTIVAAHVIEHFEDSPAMLKKMYDTLMPGGRLYIVVPDDSDLVNPDHLWFYTPASLTGVLARVGFTAVRTTVRQHIARENFIYAAAVKEDDRATHPRHPGPHESPR